MINLKTTEEINLMREGGQKLGKILQTLIKNTKVGKSLMDIENEAGNLIKNSGGTPSFMTVSGYKWATCLTVNQGIVHGIPNDYQIKDQDLLTIDIGLLYKGFHTDTAYSFIISNDPEKSNPDLQRFLNTGQNVLDQAIKIAQPGNRVGHISQTIESGIKSSGYSIVKALVGHGIGKKLHDEPQIPGFLSDSINRTPQLKEGMTIAIEVIYARGRGEIVTNTSDGWTINTKDQSLSAVFEHTIAITQTGPILLTKV